MIREFTHKELRDHADAVAAEIARENPKKPEQISSPATPSDRTTTTGSETQVITFEP